MRSVRTLATAAAVGAMILTFGGCGSSNDNKTSSGGATFTPPDLPMKKDLGKGEGAVSILAWAGYAEKQWVDPFVKATGCKATVKYFNTSDDAVNLIKTGDYDVVSASGDASLRMIAAGSVEPVNTDLVPNYKDVYSFLKNRPWNSVDGQMYGIPHGYGANLLMWNTKDVNPAPTDWSVVFGPDAAKYKGR